MPYFMYLYLKSLPDAEPGAPGVSVVEYSSFPSWLLMYSKITEAYLFPTVIL